MKPLLLIIFLISFTYAYDIKCIGKISSFNISDIDYSFSGEFDSATTVTGELDTCNFGLSFWDNSSPVCGGDGTQNILYELYNTSCNISAYVFTVGDTSGTQIHSINPETNEYQNNQIFVNGSPCLDSSTSSVTLAFYNWNDNSNIGFVTANNLSVWGNPQIYDVTEEDIKTQKNYCSNNPYDELEPQANQQNALFKNKKSSVDNVALSIDNTNSILNNILTAFNSLNDKSMATENYSNTQNTIENNLNNLSNNGLSTNDTNLDNSLSDFEDDYSNILKDTFSNYTDVLGFGGYGSAPSSISFNLLGKEYYVFNASNFEPFLNTFRVTFGSFAYLWGFLIVIKDFKQ